MYLYSLLCSEFRTNYQSRKKNNYCIIIFIFIDKLNIVFLYTIFISTNQIAFKLLDYIGVENNIIFIFFTIMMRHY